MSLSVFSCVTLLYGACFLRVPRRKEQCKIVVPLLHPWCTSNLVSTHFDRMAPRLRQLRCLSPWCNKIAQRPSALFAVLHPARGSPGPLLI